MGKIPTLEDGDLVLTESAAICLHLADKFPDARLAPPVGTPERSELYRWLLWLSNTVQMTQIRHFYPHRYGTEGVKEAADAELAGHYDQVDATSPAGSGSSATTARSRTLPLHAHALGTVPGAGRVGTAGPAGALAAGARAPGRRRMLEEQGLELPTFAVRT